MSAYRYYITPEQYEEARKNGITKKLLDIRVRSLGWDMERATTEPVQGYGHLKKWATVAEQNGICYSTFCSRIHKQRLSLKEAATRPVMTRTEIAHLSIKSRKQKVKEEEKHEHN